MKMMAHALPGLKYVSGLSAPTPIYNILTETGNGKNVPGFAAMASAVGLASWVAGSVRCKGYGHAQALNLPDHKGTLRISLADLPPYPPQPATPAEAAVFIWSSDRRGPFVR